MTDMKTEFMVEASDADRVTAEMAMAKECADFLHQHYPGHPWAVNVNSVGGTVNIFNLALSQIYGYLLYMTTVQEDPKLTCVMRAGGELLERANLKQKFNGDTVIRVDGMPEKYQPNKRMKLN